MDHAGVAIASNLYHASFCHLSDRASGSGNPNLP
jgi:hypothetical protein